nr:immunoglobulin heavy chain junction region [Mus musculus]MBK4183892.1 immunoglobulin heavy chain junction region [Mus musculus]MBK4183893.1 immunoglobulin heavy chain junction region [Mus musculus]
CARSGGHFDYW